MAGNTIVVPNGKADTVLKLDTAGSGSIIKNLIVENDAVYFFIYLEDVSGGSVVSFRIYEENGDRQNRALLADLGPFTGTRAVRRFTTVCLDKVQLETVFTGNVKVTVIAKGVSAGAVSNSAGQQLRVAVQDEVLDQLVEQTIYLRSIKESQDIIVSHLRLINEIPSTEIEKL